jgi:hypothetical protein
MGIMFILLINLQQLFGHYVSFIYEVVATFRAKNAILHIGSSGIFLVDVNLLEEARSVPNFR